MQISCIRSGFEQDGGIVAYASQVLSTTKLKYSAHKYECVAIVFALNQFRKYLFGSNLN